MTPKEKAEELVNKFNPVSNWYLDSDTKRTVREGKQCALIAVDEIIKFISDDPYYKDYTFFEEVKTEIEKL